MDTKEQMISLTPLSTKVEIQQLKNSDILLNNNSKTSVYSVRKKLSSGRLIQILATCFGALATFTTGQLMGWMSPTGPILQNIDESPIEGGVSSSEVAWIASMVMVGNMVAVPLVALTVDRIGRKPAILISSVPVFISWFLIYYAQSTEILYIARFIGGIGETYGKSIMCMYIGEIAEAKIRGALGTVLVCTLNMGILYEYAIGPYVSYKELAWISGIVPVLLLVSFIWMPESPYFFVIQNKQRRAKLALQRLRGVHDVDDEMREIRGMIEQRLGYVEGFKELFSNHVKCLVLTCGCFFSQELSGITPNIMYAKTILKDSHLGGIPPEIAPVFIPLIKIVATLTTMILVDRAGRRPLFMLSTSACAFAMGIMSVFFYCKQEGFDVSSFEWVPLSMTLFFNAMFIIGMGCLPFILIGELFSPNIKAVAVCISALCGPLSSVIATKMFQVLRDELGVYSAFGAYAICCTISFFFVMTFLPETKNRSLSQIQQALKKT